MINKIISHQKNFRVYVNYAVALLILIGYSGCEQFLEIEPPRTQLVRETAFKDDASAEAAMRGVYSYMMDKQGFASGGSSSITLLSGLSSDEFVNYSVAQERISFYENALRADNLQVRDQLWQQLYKCIYFSNNVLEGLEASAINNETRDRLRGEALFVRAFCNFYLVNLFGNVPLILTTDFEMNTQASREGIDVVYDQIINDLEEAVTSLTEDYSGGDRTYPNKYAALTLLARSYLYQGDWVKAEQYATDVINSPLFILEEDLLRVFLHDSQEAIWQLKPVIPGYNTWEGITFLLSAKPTSVAMRSQLALSFDDNDLRKSMWVDSIIVEEDVYYFPAKYKVKLAAEVTEYSMVFRLAELYLIRGEARLEQNNLSGAKEDVDAVRNRAGLLSLIDNDVSSLRDAILNERQKELFAEWGHRWVDLKRTGKATEILAPLKTDWQDDDALYPIPQTEILNAPNLSQNPGY